MTRRAENAPLTDGEPAYDHRPSDHGLRYDGRAGRRTLDHKPERFPLRGTHRAPHPAIGFDRAPGRASCRRPPAHGWGSPMTLLVYPRKRRESIGGSSNRRREKALPTRAVPPATRPRQFDGKRPAGKRLARPASAKQEHRRRQRKQHQCRNHEPLPPERGLLSPVASGPRNGGNHRQTVERIHDITLVFTLVFTWF